MNTTGRLILLVGTGLSIYLLISLLKFVHRLWWNPIRIQRLMQSQGVKGPPYKFFYGNTKEIMSLRNESLSKPMELSHHIFPRMQPHVCLWEKTYGENYLQWLGPQPQLVITESEMIKEILNNKDGVYPKPGPQQYSRKLVGDGVVSTANAQKWAKLRKVSNHAFHGESLKGMIPEMIGGVEMMLSRWKDYEGKEIEVFSEFRLLTSEVISRTAFGSSYSEGKNIFEQLTKMTLIVQRNAYKVRIPVISNFLKTSDETESDKIYQFIRDAVIGIIRNREKLIQAGNKDGPGDDFLGSLIKANHDPDERKRLSLDEIIDECKTFYVAGQETTNSLLSWIVLLLAIHTDWQEKARKEVLQIFGRNVPNLDGISKLKTLTMIIHETLRLYPPAMVVLRRVKREVTLGELRLPASTNLFIPILKLHHDPQIWGQDAHLFKPERFAEGVAKATNNNIAAFIPFGLGPRNCVGFNFALNEAKIVVSMILQRYSFTLSPSYVHSPFQIITVRPQHGVQVLLRGGS